jgi:deoxyribonuclease II
VYDKTTAFYMIHSIPLFPNFTTDGLVNTTISDDELIYAQNVMCISISTNTLFELAGIMTLIQPIVYYKNIIYANTNISNVIGDVVSASGFSGSYKFVLSNASWVYIAKSQYGNLDLWDNVVAGYFSQGLDTETWGRPYMPSVCPPNSQYPVLNINALKVGPFKWKDTEDHSKWGILDSSSFVCYGDMNRMVSQRTRGGGTVCMNIAGFYSLHRSLITGVDPCNTS